MTNLNDYVENHGKLNESIYLLIDLKREIEEVVVFLMKEKTQILDAFRKLNLFIKMNAT